MPNATVRANARALPEASQTQYQTLNDELNDELAALELPIADLRRLLRAAAHLLDDGDQDLGSSASLIVDLAFQKADELYEQYHGGSPAEGINSRTQAGAISREDA
jgi:hypothetical protein